ncbi:MAG TPA: hypothetical protein VGC78_13735, partial [Gaiellaceae bacterium]
MRIIKTKKGIALLAVLVVAAVAAIGGYAYFSSVGAGTGSASVGSSTPVVLTSTSVSGLYPGGPGVAVPVSVTNNGGGDEYVNDINGTVANNGSCLGSWFTVSTDHVGQSFAPGATAAA